MKHLPRKQAHDQGQYTVAKTRGASPSGDTARRIDFCKDFIPQTSPRTIIAAPGPTLERRQSHRRQHTNQGYEAKHRIEKKSDEQIGDQYIIRVFLPDDERPLLYPPYPGRDKHIISPIIYLSTSNITALFRLQAML